MFYGVFFDFGLFFFYNVKEQFVCGKGLYFYLFKMELYFEVWLWNDVFNYVEDIIQILCGSICVIVFIEIIVVVFEMDEIFYELCEYLVGLNCGCWDYIFFYIKKLCNYFDCVLFDCVKVIMVVFMMQNYFKFVIQICYKCGVLVIGGMSVFILVKGDEEKNVVVFEQVCVDKECEVINGYDGIWVVYFGMVQFVIEVFDCIMLQFNQIGSDK